MKSDKDYETMLLNFDRWSAVFWDFKNKYLSRDYVMTALDNRTGKMLNIVTVNTDYCSTCLNKEGNFKCNNIKEE